MTLLFICLLDQISLIIDPLSLWVSCFRQRQAMIPEDKPLSHSNIAIQIQDRSFLMTDMKA